MHGPRTDEKRFVNQKYIYVYNKINVSVKAMCRVAAKKLYRVCHVVNIYVFKTNYNYTVYVSNHFTKFK